MSGPFGSSQWMYKAGDFYEFPIEQSLKFNDNDSSYLSWTPTSAGNRRTWTWSGWVKKATNDIQQPLFYNGVDGGAEHGIRFRNDDNSLDFFRYSGGYTYRLRTSALYRDTSAWYHIVAVLDTTQGTSSDRVKLYVNGEQITSFQTATYPSQNAEFETNNTVIHRIGNFSTSYLDGYLAEVNFIDGQALDPTSFGEFKSGVWIPKDPSNLTYGTNGFRLSFQNDTVSEGFNTALYRGNGADTHSISGLGFAPDLVWVKSRSAVADHHLYDSVRGANLELRSNTTNSERLLNGTCGFHSDGFTVGTATTNTSGGSYVAWCWDAGSGSPVSNTDGSITSTVKANPDYGFSIITWTGSDTAGATIGHGLNSAPEMFITFRRNVGDNHPVYHSALGNTKAVHINLSDGPYTSSGYWNDTSPTSSVITLGVDSSVNWSAYNYVGYAFHSVAGYSKVGSYTGTGANGNAINLGWKPAFVLVKKSSNTGAWSIFDANRYDADNNYHLNANTSDAEYTDMVFQFTDTGFTVGSTGGMNHSGETFIYLAIKDTRDNAFWRDQSGNGNDWQPNNLTYQDGFPDAPTNNFATLNPNHAYDGGADYSEGNLRFVGDGSSFRNTQATIGVSSGKWYWELIPELNASANTSFGIGEDTANWNDTGGLYNNTGFWLGNFDTGTNFYYYANGSSILPDSLTFNQNDVVGLAFDADNGTFKLYANNTLMRTFTGIPAGTYLPFVEAQGTAYPFINVNFGQDSSFAGIKPAQGNTDDNGYGDFYYAPPAGYLALCTANLPDPVIDPAKDDIPSDYFNSVLYTGNETARSITGLDFQPSLTWIKSRSFARSSRLFDEVRGATKGLVSNATDAELTQANELTSFDSGGFSLGNDYDTNANGQTYVAWNWLAGNGTSSNTSGSITSTVSVNQKAGFSVVSYVGNSTNGATVGHGLNQKPKMIIVKNRNDGTKNWAVYHEEIGASKWLKLNLTDAAATDPIWASTEPTSSVFYLNSTLTANDNGDNIIAYCFAEVEGYSKFGSYTGNGSTDGPYIYLGFEPAVILLKSSSVIGGWEILDNARDPYNVAQKLLQPNVNNAEASSANHAVDFLSNGFKIRTSGGSDPAINTNGSTVIYAAWASNPFKYSNAR